RRRGCDPGRVLRDAAHAHPAGDGHRVAGAADVLAGDQGRLRAPQGVGALDVSHLVLRERDRRAGVFFPVSLVAGGVSGALGRGATPPVSVLAGGHFTTSTPPMPLRKWPGKLQTKG